MPNKVKIGTVVSAKQPNTVTVAVNRLKKHPIYQKQYRVTKKYHADTNGVELTIGDQVKIEETRPLSKTKSFRVVEKI